MAYLVVTETTLGAPQREPLRLEDPDVRVVDMALYLGPSALTQYRAYLGSGYGDKLTRIEVDGVVYAGCSDDGDNGISFLKVRASERPGPLGA
jgi:hypothetical protein